MNSPRLAAEDRLRSFVERIQRLEEEGKSINDDKRDVYAEAKGEGFDVPALKSVISYLRKDRDAAEEHLAVFDLYLSSVTGTQRATRAGAKESTAASGGEGAVVNGPHLYGRSGPASNPGLDAPSTIPNPSPSSPARSDGDGGVATGIEIAPKLLKPGAVATPTVSDDFNDIPTFLARAEQVHA